MEIRVIMLLICIFLVAAVPLPPPPPEAPGSTEITQEEISQEQETNTQQEVETTENTLTNQESQAMIAKEVTDDTLEQPIQTNMESQNIVFYWISIVILFLLSSTLTYLYINKNGKGRVIIITQEPPMYNYIQECIDKGYELDAIGKRMKQEGYEYHEIVLTLK